MLESIKELDQERFENEELRKTNQARIAMLPPEDNEKQSSGEPCDEAPLEEALYEIPDDSMRAYPWEEFIKDFPGCENTS